MARTVRISDLFWSEREFRKSFRDLSPADQEERLGELEQLSQALATCRHPVTDPDLRPWQPSPYNVSKVRISLYEYRFRYPFRVIAGFIDPSPQDPEGVVLIIAATLSHDHKRLKEVIFRNRQDLAPDRAGS
jgi:hypothetical protein